MRSRMERPRMLELVTSKVGGERRRWRRRGVRVWTTDYRHTVVFAYGGY